VAARNSHSPSSTSMDQVVAKILVSVPIIFPIIVKMTRVEIEAVTLFNNHYGASCICGSGLHTTLVRIPYPIPTDSLLIPMNSLQKCPLADATRLQQVVDFDKLLKSKFPQQKHLAGHQTCFNCLQLRPKFIEAKSNSFYERKHTVQSTGHDHKCQLTTREALAPVIYMLGNVAYRQLVGLGGSLDVTTGSISSWLCSPSPNPKHTGICNVHLLFVLHYFLSLPPTSPYTPYSTSFWKKVGKATTKAVDILPMASYEDAEYRGQLKDAISSISKPTTASASATRQPPPPPLVGVEDRGQPSNSSRTASSSSGQPRKSRPTPPAKSPDRRAPVADAPLWDESDDPFATPQMLNRRLKVERDPEFAPLVPRPRFPRDVPLSMPTYATPPPRAADYRRPTDFQTLADSSLLRTSTPAPVGLLRYQPYPSRSALTLNNRATRGLSSPGGSKGNGQT
jgi:hypothetical protein